MNKHTPGPWMISYHHDGGTEIAIDDEPGIQGERNYDLATVCHGDPDELLANARLIATAPELLQALKAAHLELHYCSQQLVESGWTVGSSVRNALEGASAAISKATGRAE